MSSIRCASSLISASGGDSPWGSCSEVGLEAQVRLQGTLLSRYVHVIPDKHTYILSCPVSGFWVFCRVSQCIPKTKTSSCIPLYTSPAHCPSLYPCPHTLTLSIPVPFLTDGSPMANRSTCGYTDAQCIAGNPKKEYRVSERVPIFLCVSRVGGCHTN